MSGAAPGEHASAQEIQEKYESFDLRTHVEKKGMWAGRTNLALIPDLQGGFFIFTDGPDGKKMVKVAVVDIPREHTPALLKAFDEYLVNASDHAIECEAGKSRARGSKVTVIDVELTKKGIFRIRNDGPGIPIVRHEATSAKVGRPMYIPEIAFCVLLSGSNMTKAIDSIKGGINGVGAKIGNIHALVFRITTVGIGEDGKLYHYTQRCSNRMHTIEPPVITPLANWPADKGPKPEPSTEVTMLPAWKTLGYGACVTTDEEYDREGSKWREVHQDIESWLRLRCCQLAAYLGPKVKVTLNGLHIATTSPATLAPLYMRTMLSPSTPYQVLETTMKAKEEPYKAHPWKIALVASTAIRTFGHHTIINGVVTKSGPHVTYIKGLLKEATLKRIKSVTKDKSTTVTSTEVCKHCVLFMVGALPGADWTGQNKNELTISGKVLANYTFTAAWLKEASELLCGMYLQASGKKKGAKSRINVEKYTKARTAGARKGGPVAHLMVAEGDSAITTLRAGLTLGKKNPTGPTFQHYGIFSLGGVPMNAARNVTDISDNMENVGPDAASSMHLVRAKALKDNKTFASLEQIIGLDHHATYALTPQGQAEFNKLHYKSIVACVDQDVDGAGKILGLMLTYFNLFWPNLIRRGFVRWFMTPIIRVYPRAASTSALRKKMGTIKEFYHEQEFETWVNDPAGGGGDMDTMASRFRISYFKGLGGHDTFEIPRMFENFESKIYTFELDEESSHRLFDVYYGADSKLRKEVLSTPLKPIAPGVLANMETTRKVPCAVQLDSFSKAYKLDAITRQIPGALDGLTTGRRKAIAGARDRFKNASQECMTFQLAGYVADKKLYHHGGASMEGIVIYINQVFPGTRQFPLLIGTGAFGTRVAGGKDAASPRYTKVALNIKLVNALLPREDDFLLPHEFVDGQRAQPHSYVPVIPMLAVYDNIGLPSEGWSSRVWPRRISQTLDILRAVCNPSLEGHGALTILLPSLFPNAVNSAESIVDAALMGSENPPAAPPIPDENVVKAMALQQVIQQFPLDISLRGVTGRTGMRNGKLHHYGTYMLQTIEGDPDGDRGCVIRVTDLPLRTWSTPFSEGFIKKSDGSPNDKAQYVTSVDDYSNDEQCNICITLAPGALGLIKEKYTKKSGSDGDPIEEFLGIHASLYSLLNAIRPHPHGTGGVIEFGDNYHMAVLYYIPSRARYYQLRYERRRVILELRIRMETEILRYMDMVAKATIIPISKIADDREANQVLASHEFPRINKSKIDSPTYETLDELRAFTVEVGNTGDVEEEMTNPDGEVTAEDEAGEDGESDMKATKKSRASYGYILNLRERDLIISNQKKRQAKIDKYKAELAEVIAILAEKPFPAASVWLREIAEVESILQAQGFYS